MTRKAAAARDASAARLRLPPGEAWLVEVFSSLQGEGSRLGERPVFVRFGGCHRRCDYCDEPDTIPIPSGARPPLAGVRVIDAPENLRLSRLRICDLTARVLKTGLRLLGIETIERM